MLFPYREVLHQGPGLIDTLRAKKPKRLPTVLTKEEAQRLLAHLSGTHQLMAKLLYGSGLRLMECLRLRVKDLDFAHRAILVRDGKGTKDRVTVLPDSVIPALQKHLQYVKRLHEEGLAKGYGAVYLPDALERKYPNAHREWGWQSVFPAGRLSVDVSRPVSLGNRTGRKASRSRPSVGLDGEPDRLESLPYGFSDRVWAGKFRMRRPEASSPDTLPHRRHSARPARVIPVSTSPPPTREVQGGTSPRRSKASRAEPIGSPKMAIVTKTAERCSRA